jgi:hypothetical protein
MHVCAYVIDIFMRADGETFRRRQAKEGGTGMHVCVYVIAYACQLVDICACQLVEVCVKESDVCRRWGRISHTYVTCLYGTYVHICVDICACQLMEVCV